MEHLFNLRNCSEKLNSSICHPYTVNPQSSESAVFKNKKAMDKKPMEIWLNYMEYCYDIKI